MYQQDAEQTRLAENTYDQETAMSTPVFSISRIQAASKQGLFRGLWPRPRLIDVTASELPGSHALPPNHRCIAFAAQWEGCSIGEAVLEMRGRTAVIRMLHVDAA